MSFYCFFKDIFFIAVTVYDVTICQMFQLVCQWVQCKIFPVFSFQCLSEQIIADVRVLGEEGAVKVSPYYIFVNDSFVTGFAGVAQTIEDFAEGCVFSYVGAAAMVFKSYNRGVEEWAVQDDVAD